MQRKKVALIYTGGTLGMVQTERGLSPSPNLRALLEDKIPELGSDRLPQFELIAFGKAADSADFSPRIWYELAVLVRERASDCDGFVIIHGTDTMAYTASALSFLLAGVRTPVILTGSQLPLGELRSDARANLLTAMEVAASGRILEAVICFGNSVLRGNRASKVHSVAFDAFLSPNFPVLASVGTEVRYRGIAPPPSLPEALASSVGYRQAHIVVIPVHPGFDSAAVTAIASTRADGVILECYGAGTFPQRDSELADGLGELAVSDTVVVAISQCLCGGADLQRYTSGRSLIDSGVISGLDVTREAAYAKLHFLLAHSLSKAKIKQYMSVDLRGELGSARY